MAKVNIMSVDLAKNSIQVLGLSEHGSELFNRKISRQKLYEFIVISKPRIVLMEACGMAHYWGRRFEQADFEVKLIPPQVVRPFRLGEKNDSNDAMAIYVAGQRPGVHFVPVKSEQHQVLQMWVRKREALISARTELVNSTRSYLAEFGLVIPQGIHKFMKAAKEIRSCWPSGIDSSVLEILERDWLRLASLNEEIKFFDDKIHAFTKQDSLCKRMQEVGGVGEVTAVAIRAAVVYPHLFKNGRQFSAYLGLVPRQNSTGGKTRLGRIAKDGNRYIRQLLIHGGRSFLWSCGSKTDSKSLWAIKKRTECGFNKACVAVANKNARNIWCILAKSQETMLVA